MSTIPDETTMSTQTASIEALHLGKTGKVSDKWQSYLPSYDRLFAPLRDKPVSLLEIGIQNGGSLETWCHYFAQGQRFVGCDVNPKCTALHFDDLRVSVVVGNANGQDAFNAIRAICPVFDIVIDDGSHISSDILLSFVNYFPLLKPGGVFVVEDTHTLYMDGFGGGLLNDFSAYAFFKKLVDVINFQFWKDDLSINNYLRTFFPLVNTPGFITEGWVDQIEFRNSMIVIRKAVIPTHEKLGERIIVGSTAVVQNLVGRVGMTATAAADFSA